MLIEGSSDMILCRYLCNRLNLNLDVAGSQIIPVEGKGQFPVITKLFRLIGKEVCVLTDLDGFTDDNNIVNCSRYYMKRFKLLMIMEIGIFKA